ncbi:MAG: FmdB family transcriptional regulator [Chloroflexi bacterium]|nr:FmdB family transcriptional regulator [Chloroflexota bacterium]MBT6707611.1 FmdB family transcriptional regulator [Chloroflexota bacterium]
MPTYIYKCVENKHVFELIQKFSDEPGADCPTCGSESKRQISAPTVIYKGSGFYTTDYGSGSAPGTKSNGSSLSSDSSSSDSGTSSGSSNSSSSESKSSDSSSGSSDSSSHSHGGGSSHSHGAGSHTH